MQPGLLMNAPKRRHDRHPGSTKKSPPPPEPEPKSARQHGDSYSEVARDDDLIGTGSTHGPSSDRRAEEPADAAPDSTTAGEDFA